VRDGNFSGLGCRTNRTLSFVAVDSLENSALTNNLGVNLSEFTHQTALLIHHTEQEVQYLFREMITRRSLVEFIFNYTENRLNRHLRSTGKYIPVPSECTESNLCLPEVTSESFMSIVLDDDKDVVLLYYASWCGFCIGVSHIFLEAARYFSSVPDILFARINGERNDLPWEYTADKYPTILYFPAGRKTESSSFPEELPITMFNLVHFVLANTGLTNRLSIAMKLCNSEKCHRRNRLAALSQVQKLTGDLRTCVARIHHVESALKNASKQKQISLMKYRTLLNDELRATKVELEHSKRLMLTLSDLRYGNFKSWQKDAVLQWQKELIRTKYS